jgi:sulfite oxidase
MDRKPPSNSGLIIHSVRPLNAEPPLARLRAAFLTPQRDFYIRSHGKIPQLDAATHKISVRGRAGLCRASRSPSRNHGLRTER